MRAYTLKWNENFDFGFIIINSPKLEILVEKSTMIDYIDRELKTRLVLPFAVSEKDRTKAFTKDMEVAAIFYLAESNREKGEGHILKKTDEKLVFITEAYYPLWLVPWRGATLLFDGLGGTSQTFSYDSLPDVKAFNKDIRRSAKTCKAYSAALSRNANYFEKFVGKEKKTIEGLITYPEFIQDYSLYGSKVKRTKKSLANKVFLSPIFKVTEISASIKDLSDLRARIEEDVKNLHAGMKLVNKTTGEKVKAIREEIQKIRKKFDKRIEKLRPRVTKKVRRIQEKHDKKISRISKRFEIQLRRLHKDHVKLEKTQKRLKRETKRFETKIKSYKHRKNKRNEIQLAQKLERIRKTLPTLEKKVKKIEREVKKLETAKNLEISEKRTECDSRIEESVKILRELEASREARIKIKKSEMTSMEEIASLIINQINELAKLKKAALTRFESISMARRRKKRAQAYLPFYFVRYERESDRRYDIYPPSVVSGMGMLAKLKGVFGATKMKYLLQPRSKAITVLLTQLVTLVQKNPMLEKEVTEAGIQNSILRTKELRLGVKRGLKDLKEEKWISKNELQAMGELLFIHTPRSHSHKRIKMKGVAHALT